MFDFRKAKLAAYLKERANGNRTVQAWCSAAYFARYGERSPKRRILPSRWDAYDGVERTELPNGWYYTVEFACDTDHEAPWDACDGMGVVKESRGSPGEYGEYNNWILNSERGWYRYYDWKETLPEAIRDGWNTSPYNFPDDRARAMAAMRSTFEFLRKWCNDEWWYVGLIVKLYDSDGNELGEDSCWGYESSSMEYITSEVRSWLAHMIVKARKEAREAARQVRIAHRFADVMENAL